MITLRQPATTGSLPAPAVQKLVQPRIDRRFCPSMFCLTDEIIVRRIAKQAQVWLLTDEREEHSWLMMGDTPVCPHCGTRLR
jgi:hypothetical protein